MKSRPLTAVSISKKSLNKSINIQDATSPKLKNYMVQDDDQMNLRPLTSLSHKDMKIKLK